MVTNPGVPQEIMDLAEMSPLEDVALYILRQSIKTVPIYSLIPEAVQSDAFIVVRKSFPFGIWSGDPRFVDQTDLEVHVFARNPDGDARCAVISEAVRVVMHRAWMDNLHIPGRGYVSRCEMVSEPARKTDWASSTGPVQYADLPEGFWRYETKYSLTIRRQR